MSLHGSLRDFGVPDIFQLVAQQGKSGVLEIKGTGRTFEIWFREGRVLRASPAERRPDDALADLLLRTGVLRQTEIDAARAQQADTLEPLVNTVEGRGAASRADLETTVRILTKETLFDLFRCEEGDFRFRPESVEPGIGDEEVSADLVLMDTIRMKDEWPRIEVKLPDLASVPAPSVDIEAFRARRGKLEKELGVSGEMLERLYMLADGRRSARRVIDLSRLGTFEGARGLVALSGEQLIRFTAPRAEPPRLTPHLRRPEGRIGPATLGLAVLAASTLVAGTLWLTPTPGAGSIPIPTDTLASARQAEEGTRIRKALEVERWVSGTYPDTLEGLADRVPGPLAPQEGARYSYERLSGGYRLYRLYP